jgi:pimeloyl-ACP methyl ester carboxylesterase
MAINKTDKVLLDGNKKLHYSDNGTGNPVVLLHGYLECGMIWNDFAAALGRHYRVLCPDLPGHGASDVLGEVQHMEMLAESVMAILEETGEKKVVMVGHSLGGYVAMAFLERFPERLSGLSLFHSHPLADAPQTIAKRKKEIKLIEQGRKDLIYNVNIPNAFATKNLERFSSEIEKAKQLAANTPDQGIKAMLRGMMERPDHGPLLQQTPTPFLWILGQLDHYIPYNEIQQQVVLPENGHLFTLENSGHMGFIEEFDQSLRVLRDFIDQAF